jgi:hypothetical protein
MEEQKEPHTSAFCGTNKDLSVRKLRLQTSATKDGESTMSEYILIKLRSGEEIIASVLSKNRTSMKVSRPMIIRQIPFMDHANGSLKAASVMENWIGRTNENEVSIPNSWVGIKMSPNQEIIDAYEKYKEREDNPSLPPLKEQPKTLREEVDEEKKREMEEYEKEVTRLMKEMSADAGIFPPMQDMSNFDATINSQLNPKDPAGKEVIVVNFMIPAKIFRNLVEEGFIEDLMTAGMNVDDEDDDDLEDDVDPSTRKLKDDQGIRDTEDTNWGNSLKDWSPDPKDYL